MGSAKIPATIVTGFLGSGKTTLLRHILQHAAGLRIAVIVNEFGELGVDGEILRACAAGCESDPGGGIYELANGCVCCTVQEEFFPVMQQLAERRERIDALLIETSGLALPKPLVQAFQWPEIASTFTVDAVVTVVDTPALAAGQFAADPLAVAAQRRTDPGLDHESSLQELFEDQLSAADLVLLNKTDLVDAATLAQVRTQLRAALPAAVKLAQAAHGRLPLTLLLGLQHDSQTTIAARPCHHDVDHDDGHDGDHDSDHDHEAFDQIVIELPAVAREPLLQALATLLAEHDILRAKGFAALPGKPMRLLLQAVGRRLESHFDRAWRADEARRTQLVLIGRALDAAALRAALQPLALA
jgi:cobalamin biosynthesis protein CobW